MAGEWHTNALGGLTVNHDSKRKPVKEADRKPGPYPYYGASGIVDYVDEYLIDGDYLLIAEDGENLRTRQTPIAFMARGKSWVNNHAHIVTGNDKADTLFLMYAIQATDIGGYLTGAVMPKLTQGNLNKIQISYPSLDEQRAIAHVLGTLDDKIELNRRMNETLEAIARAIFKSWFVDFDPVRAKASGEPPESICRRLGLTPDRLALFPDRLVNSELGEIPEGWEVKAVEDVAKVVKGKSYKSSELAPSKTALVTLKSFNRGGGYRLDGLKEYTGSYKPEQEVIGGDLVVAYTDVTQAADVIGKPALVISDSAYEHLVISLDVAVVRPLRDEYRVYLYGVMSGVEFQQHTRAHTTGTTVLHLASNAVPGFKFTFPGEELVGFYATIAAPMFASIDERVAEGRTLASIRDTLLPKLLSGELRTPITGAL